ncbi:MAG TPA: tubulin-like doman-containing protein [Mycobacteriales bacterium]|nr:tubulin-like doman-containing protein [Mycobacteriales bacterium]
MKIYQPMLYVGLGGTGCLVGAELERRLREELCGPDGTDLQALMTGLDFLPYQLPSCLQFVYADLNEAELTRLRRGVVPSEQHAQAAARTTHLVDGLVPQHNTYPEVARSLRLNAGELVSGWLPPPAGEPRVAPLVRGAGQLPTVGRATLLETFRRGLGPAQRPVTDAIGQLSKSGGEMLRLGGKLRGSIDVFVAFSVAGGTGSGIFYDYLHLIGDAVAGAGYQAQIYPLVLMPSAFTDGMGGGRAARLNAGRALLDLFRLVDDQNGQAAETELNDLGLTGALSIRYPNGTEIRLRPTTVQTGFLFSRTAGVEREDLHRSVVSLILSLVGTEQGETGEPTKPSDRLYQSFADDFINRGVDRQLPAESGLGSRGVSTSLVASMTVPVDDLADIVSSRLLAAGVAELSVPPPGVAETNRPLIERAFGLANIEPLRTRSPLEFTEPQVPKKGADAVVRALSTRAQTMEAFLDALERTLAEQVPVLAQDFDPRRAAREMLGEIDIFRLHRVMLGHKDMRDPADQQGFVRLLEGRRREPEAPSGITVYAPQPGPLRDRLFRRVRWADPPVLDAVERQNQWYSWRARRLWHAAWADQTQRWERKSSDLRRDLTAILDAFTEHVRAETGRFARRAQDLYRPRIGVSYLLPPHNDLEPFYQEVVRRFVAYFVARGQLRPTATAGDIVREVVGADTWREALRLGMEVSAAQAVEVVRDRLKQEVLRLFRHKEAGERPLLPALAELLAAAGGKEGASVSDADLAQFRHKLAGLVPGGFSPQGSGQLKILLSYAAAVRDKELEAYLRQEVNLPRAAGTVVEFRPIDAESIVVVLFRTSMSITEVPELRDVLRHWADAARNEQPQDYLRWRQRLGYDFGYLISTEEHRVHILHRLLCALWNGQVHVQDGGPFSPRRVSVRLGVQDAASMTLPLTAFERSSSWGSILRAYEEWSIADDEQIRRDFCARLMATAPVNVEESPDPPSELYQLVRDMAEEQEATLVELIPRLPESSRGYARALYTLWSRTLPAALDLPFSASNPVRGTLRELEKAVGR